MNSRRSLSSLRDKVGIAFIIALISVMAMGALQYRTERRLEEENQRVSHTQEVLRDLAALRNGLNRADASAQSFVITGDSGYLTPFIQATKNIRDQLQSLGKLTADNAGQQDRLDKLEPLENSSIRALQSEIDARKAGTLAPEELLPLENSVRKATDDARLTVADMEAEEAALLRQRNEAAQRSNHQTNLLILFGSLTAFVLLGASGVALYFDMTARREVEASRIKAYEALERANEGLEKQVAERRQAELRLQASEQSLRQLSLRLLQTQDDERRRIARELHDNAGQYLAAIGMALDAARNAALNLPTPLIRKLEEASEITKACITEVRTLSHLLHPPLLEELGLSSAVRWYVEGFSDRSGIRVQIEMPEELGRLGDDVEIVLFRVLQESLTNIHRHSQSKTATIRIGADSRQAWLEVQDEGKGRDDGNGNVSSEPFRAGVGITGMRERVTDLAGVFEISPGGNGTRVKAVLPLAPERPKIGANVPATSGAG
jgi:signal transduction histidine kinase